VKQTSHHNKIVILYTIHFNYAKKKLEFKKNSFPSHVPKYQPLIKLYFTSPLTVAVFTETLRKYPSLPFLERKCCSDYELPAPNGNGTITLPAGTGVYIPAFGLHYDPTYVPEPEKFDPARFTEQNKRSRPNYTYIPFGEGPRMCIGKGRQTGFGRICFRH
jgi:cytochrome P450